MADYTVAGIIGIVAIVIVTAAFLQQSPTMPSGDAEPLAGSAYATLDANAPTCTPKTQCEGSKLVSVQSDCSVREVRCKLGCDAVARSCN